MKNKLVTFSTIFLSVIICQPQLPFRGTIKTAKMLERQGDLDNAIAIYKGILENKPDHYQAIINLKNLYKNNQLYDQGISFLTNQIRIDSMNISHNIDLLELYFLDGQKIQFDELWSSSLKRYKKNKSYYRLLNKIFTKYNLEKNIKELSFNGRNEFGNSFLAFDIGVYYQSKNEYTLAMNEFGIELLNNMKNYSRVERRILMMSDDKESHEIIKSKLLVILTEKPDLISKILCAFYFKLQQFDNAFQIKKKYSKGNINDLNDWIKFASNLDKEKQFKYSAKAYNYVIDKNMDNKITETALLGLAKAFENQILLEENKSLINFSYNHNTFFKDPFKSKNNLSLENLSSSLILYDSLITSIKDQSILSEVCYRLGEVQFKIIHDFDNSLLLFQKALNASPNRLMKQKIIIRIIDTHIAKGNPKKGKRFLLENKNFLTYNQVKEKSILCNMFMRNSSELVLSIDSVLSEIDLENPLFNDLMELKIFFSKYYSADNQNKSALTYFMKSEFYVKQKKIGDAINQLVYLIDNHPNSNIISLAILRISLLYYKIGEYEKTIKYSSYLQNTEFEDQGIILSGQTYQYELNELNKALNNYMKIINEFPQSIFFEPIRFHVRKLKEEEKI